MSNLLFKKINTYGGGPSSTPLEDLFYQDFSQDTSLGYYTNTIPNTTLSIVSNKLQISTTSSAGVYNIIAVDTNPINKSHLNNWSMQIIFNTSMTISSTSFGLRLCRKFSKTTTDLTTGPSGGETTCYFDTRSTATGFCQISIKGVQKSISAAGFAITNGDRLRATMSGNGFTITALFENLTTGQSSTTSFTITTSSVGDVNNYPGNYSILSIASGSTIVHQVESIRVYSSYKKAPDFAFLGDSITTGWCASTASNSWPNLLMSTSSKSYIKDASPGATVQTGLDCINDLLYIKPKRVIIMLGGNDVASPGWTSVRQAVYINIIARLKFTDIKVIHCYATPRNATDMTAFNSWIDQNFYSDLRINTFTPLSNGTQLNATYDSGDGIHPNNAGHSLIASTISGIISSLL